MKSRLAIPLFLALALLLGACGGDDEGEDGAAGATPTAVTQQVAPTPTEVATEAATEPATDAVTDTEGTTDTGTVTDTADTDASEELTGTEGMTGTDGMTDTGAGGELATPDPGTAITGTEGITGAPVATPGATGTETGALTETTTAAGMGAASMRGVLRASELLDFDVQNAEGEDLGDIEDAMVSLDQGCLDYMLLSFGGILGLGENQYLIPWHAVSTQPDLQRVLLNIDPEALNDAPVFDPNNLPDMTAENWDADLLTYWETIDIFDQEDEGEAGAMTGTTAMTGTESMTDAQGSTVGAGAMAQPCVEGAASATTGATETTTDTADSEEGQINVQTPRVIRLSELMDYGVQNSEGEDLGAIEDIMVDWRSEQLAYTILSFGGFLGLGEKWFVIPLDQLTLDPIEQRLVFDVEPERLENAPGFDVDQLPDTTDPNWDQEIRDYWTENQ